MSEASAPVVNSVATDSITKPFVLGNSFATENKEKNKDDEVTKPVSPVSNSNGTENDKLSIATQVPSQAPAATPASLPLTDSASAPLAPSAPATNGSSPVDTSVASGPAVGEKRKTDDTTKEEPSSTVLPSSTATVSSNSHPSLNATVEDVDSAAEEPAAKKAKTDDAPVAVPHVAPAAAPATTAPAEAPVKEKEPVETPVTAAASVPAAAPPAAAPELQVNLGPAFSVAEVTNSISDGVMNGAPSDEANSGASLKKTTSREKREKKPAASVGRTARKTRSQGPA